MNNAHRIFRLFDAPLNPGKYTLVLGMRCGKDTDFKVRRCLADVRAMAG